MLDPTQFAVLGSPIRQRILEILCMRQRNVAGLTRDLGAEAPLNLYYHVNKLVEAGLVTVVRTKQCRGAVEKFYRAVAGGFSTPRGVRGQGDLVDVAAASADNAIRDLATALETGEVRSVEDLLLSRVIVRTSPERFTELRRELEAWLHKLAAANGEGEVEVATMAMLFPRAGRDRLQ